MVQRPQQLATSTQTQLKQWKVKRWWWRHSHVASLTSCLQPTSSSGVGILFTVIGFIGFNFASHLHISLSNHNYHSALVGMVAISTILSGSVAALITAVVHRFVDRKNTRNIYTSSFNGAVCGKLLGNYIALTSLRHQRNDSSWCKCESSVVCFRHWDHIFFDLHLSLFYHHLYLSWRHVWRDCR